MQQTLYTKPIDGFPPGPPPQVQSTIYTNPQERPAFEFLQLHNYLGEFKSEVDKARVRENLGIPDDYSYNWGHIGGSIQNQTDLMSILNNLTKKYTTLDDTVAGLSTTVNTIIGQDDDSQYTTKQLYSEILKLQIDVAQNSRDITAIETGSDTTLTTQVAANKTNIASLQSTVSNLHNYDDSSILARLTALEGKSSTYDDTELRGLISNLQTQITYLQSQISSNELTSITLSQSSISAIVGTEEQNIIVTAHYTKQVDTDVTSQVTVNSSNSSVATWNGEAVVIGTNGSATLTFSYGGYIVELAVTVANQEEPEVQTKMSYIGWTSGSYTQILNNTPFGTYDLNHTWTAQGDYQMKIWGSDYPIFGFVCVPSGTIISQIDYGGVTETPTISTTDGGYNIYYLGKVASQTAFNNLSITIITKNG